MKKQKSKMSGQIYFECHINLFETINRKCKCLLRCKESHEVKVLFFINVDVVFFLFYNIYYGYEEMAEFLPGINQEKQ